MCFGFLDIGRGVGDGMWGDYRRWLREEIEMSDMGKVLRKFSRFFYFCL